MIKYDKILTVGLFVLEILYFIMIKALPEKAARYPFFVLSLLFALTVILGIQSFMKKEKEENSGLFAGFQIKQFLFIVGISFVYILCIDVVGFFTSSLIYLIVIMFGLKANIKWAIISSVIFCILIYLIFMVFLKVPVPRGFLI